MYLAVAPKGQRPALLPECSLALPFFPGVLGVCRTSSFQETLAGTLGLSPTGAQSLMQHRGKEVPQRSVYLAPGLASSVQAILNFQLQLLLQEKQSIGVILGRWLGLF